jgi:hypothetical protein
MVWLGQPHRPIIFDRAAWTTQISLVPVILFVPMVQFVVLSILLVSLILGVPRVLLVPVLLVVPMVQFVVLCVLLVLVILGVPMVQFVVHSYQLK